MLSKPPQTHANKNSLALNGTKQLCILSYSASEFNFESKIGEADQNHIQVNSPSGMLWHWRNQCAENKISQLFLCVTSGRMGTSALAVRLHCLHQSTLPDTSFSHEQVSL